MFQMLGGASGVRLSIAPNGGDARDRGCRARGASAGQWRGSTTALAPRQRRRPWGLAVALTATPGIVVAMLVLGGLARTGDASGAGRAASGGDTGICGRVLGVAALSVFVVVALFQMANLYAEGLGLAGPGIASPTADACCGRWDAGDGPRPPAPRATSGAAASCPSLPDRPPVPRCALCRCHGGRGRLRADEPGHGLHRADGEDRQRSRRHGRLQRDRRLRGRGSHRLAIHDRRRSRAGAFLPRGAGRRGAA